MSWPLVQVVDSLDRANVLFDFNPGRYSVQQMWLGADDFDYGTPEWDSSPFGLVEGSRTISLGFRAQGRSAESEISRLSEILTRATPGYLMWQTRFDAEPLWFRLQRNLSANPLDFSTVWADDADRSTWRWKIDLLADAFALGTRQQLTATTQLAQAGQSMKPPVEITDPILGDAPAPLNLDISAGDLTGYTTQLMSWAVDLNATVDPWAGVLNPSATFTGGSFSSARAGELPQIPPPGQFRGLLYVTRSGTTGASRWQVAIDDGYGNPLVRTPPVTHTPPDGALDGWWVDCGRINLPPGMDFTELPEDSLPPVDWQIRFSSTTSNSWSVSRFMAVPVQTTVSRAATTVLDVTWASGGSPVRVDSERSRVGLVDVDGKWVMTSPPLIAGSFPRLHPGSRNYLMFLPRLNGVTKRSYGTSGQTSMWYYPRYLHVGGR